MKDKSKWFIYMLECVDGTYYTGITTNIIRRVHEHNHTKKGAKYTRSRSPVVLLGWRECSDRSDAMKHEYRVKKLPRHEKVYEVGWWAYARNICEAKDAQLLKETNEQ